MAVPFLIKNDIFVCIPNFNAEFILEKEQYI